LLPFRRAAFTLVEMLVSLAVLAVALAVVGVVFSVTTRTASQSAAYAEVHGRVREFVRQIKEDLNACNPAESVLVLVGRTQAASLTQPDLEAGKFHRTLLGDPAAVADYDPEYAPAIDPNGVYSDPRADLLMFFTNRPTPSAAVDPNDPNIATSPYALGVKFSPIRVVYGHAAIAQPQWIGTTYTFPLASALPPAMQHIEQTITVSGRVMSRLPANRWHLGRLGTIVDPNAIAGTTWFSNNARGGGADPGAVPGGIPYYEGSTPLPGDAAVLDRAAFLAKCSNLAVLTGPTAPYNYPGAPWSSVAGLVNDIDSLVYGDPALGTAMHHVATVLDELPVDLKSNLAVQMLPGCAWFQVEFLMPEDPRNSVTYSSPNPNDPTFSQRSDMPRWTQVTPGSTYVFVPDTHENRQAIINQFLDAPTEPTNRLWDYARKDQDRALHAWTADAVSQRIIRLWPYAIRVTVRAWDSRGVLPEPIVRSVVHRFE
jgi:prepilin-type N-terminal cleavage/methylation domain-containing protein